MLDKPNGKRVVLEINGTKLPMSYNTAIDLAVMLRGYSKQAKANAGDVSTRVLGFANLTDAVTEELRIQKSRDGTAAFMVR
jgi:hypothetical protein